MMTVVLILAGCLITLLIGVALFRSVRGARPARLEDLEVLLDSGIDRYAHLQRLLDPADFAFVASLRRGADRAAGLRRRRARVLLRYARQIREDFQRLVALANFFAVAPTARAQHFARQLSLQRVRFYRTYWALVALARLNYLISWPLDLGPLASELKTLRARSERLLAAFTPEDLTEMREFLART